LPRPEWTQAEHDWSFADKRLELPRHLVAEGVDGPLEEALERTERIVPRLEVSEPVICHGDFHMRNLLVDGGTTWVIDWTDAGIGDRHGDIARCDFLFRFSGVALGGWTGRLYRALAPVLSRRYLSSYRRDLPIDSARLRLWMPLIVLHQWAFVVAREHPRAAAWAEEQFRLCIEDLP